MKALLKGQKIRIDAHQWGAGEQVGWDNIANDIHIDKTTNWRVKGKQLQVRIRIPINSERPISIDITENIRKKVKVLSIAENQLIQEIHAALSNPETRKAFIDDLINILQNYPTAMGSLEQARGAIERLGKHFNLPEKTSGELLQYTGQRIETLTSFYTTPSGNYFIQVNRNSLVAGQVPGNRIRLENNGRFTP